MILKHLEISEKKTSPPERMRAKKQKKTKTKTGNREMRSKFFKRARK